MTPDPPPAEPAREPDEGDAGEATVPSAARPEPVRPTGNAPAADDATSEAAQLMQVAHRAFQAAAFRVARDTAARVLALVPDHEEATALRRLATEKCEAARRTGTSSEVAPVPRLAQVKPAVGSTAPDSSSDDDSKTIAKGKLQTQSVTATGPAFAVVGRQAGAIPRDSRKRAIYGGVAAVLVLAFITMWRLGSRSADSSATSHAGVTSPATPSAETPGAPPRDDDAGSAQPETPAEPSAQSTVAAPVPALPGQEVDDDDAVELMTTTARRHLDAGRFREALSTTATGLQLRRSERDLRDILNRIARHAESALNASRDAATQRGALRAPSFELADAAEAEGRRIAASGNTIEAVQRFWRAAALFDAAAGEAEAAQSNEPPAPAPDVPVNEPPAAVPEERMPVEPEPQPQAPPATPPRTVDLPAAATGPVRISSSEAPALLKRVDPIYPSVAVTARKIGWEGTVTLDVLIRKDGRVGDVKVVASTNHVFDRNAIDAVKRWQYAPPDREVILTVKVSFRMPR